MKNEMELLYWMVGRIINKVKFENIRDEKLISEVDIELFLQIVNKNKCLPLVKIYLDFFDKKYHDKIIEEYDKFIIYNSQLLSIAKEVASISTKRNIEIFEPKGISLALTIYGDLNKRQFNDLDFIVEIKNLTKLGNILVEQGLYHRHNGDIEDICNNMSKYKDSLAYEIKFIKNYKDLPQVCIELKKCTDAVDYSGILNLMELKEDIFLTNGISYKTFSKEGLLLHLCANIYTDHYRYEGVFSDAGKFRNFVDLYFFVKNVNYDIEKLKKLAIKCNLYHCIKLCEQIMWKLFSFKLFGEFLFIDCKDIYFLTPSLMSYEKKLFFLKRYINCQKEHDKENFVAKDNYKLIFKDIKIDIELEFKKIAEIKMALSAKKNFLYNLLKDKRLYLCFVLNLSNSIRKETDNDLNLDTYYRNNQSICIYAHDDIIYTYQDELSLFFVANANTDNKNIDGKRITKINNDSEMVTLQFSVELPENYINNKIYFNSFFDIKLLKDYYKHDEYLYYLGEPFKRIK